MHNSNFYLSGDDGISVSVVGRVGIAQIGMHEVSGVGRDPEHLLEFHDTQIHLWLLISALS